jgi:hypothetical protein
VSLRQQNDGIALLQQPRKKVAALGSSSKAVDVHRHHLEGLARLH